MSGKVVPIAAARKPGASASLPTAGLTSDEPGRVPDSFADLPIEFLLDVDSGELQEFVAADSAPVVADPLFKERLRRALWTMVRARLAPPGGPSSSG